MIKTKNNRNKNQKNNPLQPQQKNCYFCVKGYKDIDYKDFENLKRYTSSYGKIVPRRRSNVCAFHQRKLAKAIKLDRILALLPFMKK